MFFLTKVLLMYTLNVEKLHVINMCKDILLLLLLYVFIV